MTATLRSCCFGLLALTGARVACSGDAEQTSTTTTTTTTHRDHGRHLDHARPSVDEHRADHVGAGHDHHGQTRAPPP